MYVCNVLCVLSHVRLFVTPWTVALQAPLSMGFSSQEYWSGLPSPPPGDPLTMSPALAGRFFSTLPLAPLGSPMCTHICI